MGGILGKKHFQAALVGLICISAGMLAPARAAAGEIVVSAAASLTNAFTEMKTVFEQKHPEIVVRVNFAASNPLLKQMEEGAPVDVFASADQETMDKAVAKKLVDPATRRDFAKNDLVMAVPADTGKGGGASAEQPEQAKQAELAEQAALEGLTRPEVRLIAIGNPDSVPAGRYAKEALTSMGLWEGLHGKFVFGASVRQVLDYVGRGEADAGFMYRTDALQGGAAVKTVAVMRGHRPVLYPIAVGTGGNNAGEAALFVAFALSPEGQAVLGRYGFSQAE